jgi:hypothetical protein
MIIVRIFAQGLAIFSVVLVAILDYQWHDKRTGRFKKLKATLFVILGICLITSVWLTVHDDRQHAKEINTLNESLGTLKAEALNQGVQAQRRDSVTQKQLAELAENNGRLQKSLAPFQQLADRLFASTPQQDRLGLLERQLNTLSHRTEALEVRSAGRRLSGAACDYVRQQLSPYTGQTLRITVLGGDAEAMQFASDIFSCFERAGIDFPQRPNVVITPDSWSGLDLAVPITAPPGFAEALVRSLEHGGTTVRLRKMKQGIAMLNIGSQPP